MAWYVAAAFSLASGLRSAQEYKRAGAAARRDALAQAAEIRRQKMDVAMIATQQHQDRMEQFQELASQNEAILAMTGRTGRSVAALRKREERRYGRDIDRIRSQEAREKESLEGEARATEARGVTARKTYRAKARQTLFDTAYKASSLAPKGD